MMLSKAHRAIAIGPRDEDGVSSDYDMSDSMPNPYADRFVGAIVVPVDDEIRREFPDAEAIQMALRKVIAARKKAAARKLSALRGAAPVRAGAKRPATTDARRKR